MHRTLLLAVCLLLTLIAPAAHTQQTAQSASELAWLASFTPQQKIAFQEVSRDFSAGDFKSALPKLRKLHEEIPENDTLPSSPQKQPSTPATTS